jgi:hypothetical protein
MNKSFVGWVMADSINNLNLKFSSPLPTVNHGGGQKGLLIKGFLTEFFAVLPTLPRLLAN